MLEARMVPSQGRQGRGGEGADGAGGADGPQHHPEAARELQHAHRVQGGNAGHKEPTRHRDPKCQSHQKEGWGVIIVVAVGFVSFVFLLWILWKMEGAKKAKKSVRWMSEKFRGIRTNQGRIKFIEDFIFVRLRAAYLSKGVYSGIPWNCEDYQKFNRTFGSRKMPMSGTITEYGDTIRPGDGKMYTAVMKRTRINTRTPPSGSSGPGTPCLQRGRCRRPASASPLPLALSRRPAPAGPLLAHFGQPAPSQLPSGSHWVCLRRPAEVRRQARGLGRCWGQDAPGTDDGEEVEGEVVFRGTNLKDINDLEVDLTSAMTGCLKGSGPFVEQLKKFVKDKKVTKLNITGHSLGGLRACHVGLHAEVVEALMKNVEDLYSIVVDPKKIILERIQVTAFDPAGNSAGCYENTDMDRARQSVITNISHAITGVSKYVTGLLSPLWVFAASENSVEDHSMDKIEESMLNFITKEFDPEDQRAVLNSHQSGL